MPIDVALIYCFELARKKTMIILFFIAVIHLNFTACHAAGFFHLLYFILPNWNIEQLCCW